MKKLSLFIYIMMLSNLVNAQLAVFDAALNKKLVKLLKENSITAGYEQIKTEISKGSLREALTTADQVGKHFSLINEVYTSIKGISDLKKYKVFYNRASLINNTITGMTRYLATTQKTSIPSEVGDIIKKGIRDAMNEVGLATEIISFGITTSNNLSIRERLAQIDEANEHLDQAAIKLFKGASLIKVAQREKEMKEKSDYYKMRMYGIK